jgi:hypothetical protein
MKTAKKPFFFTNFFIFDFLKTEYQNIKKNFEKWIFWLFG